MDANKKSQIWKIVWSAISAVVGLLTGLSV